MTKKVCNKVLNSEINIDKDIIEKDLYQELPSIDLLIRTSGEYRISNYMLWQLAYAEMYFAKCHWPAFNKKCLKEALLDYQSRDRRFGAIKEEKE